MNKIALLKYLKTCQITLQLLSTMKYFFSILYTRISYFKIKIKDNLKNGQLSCIKINGQRWLKYLALGEGEL